MAGSAIVAAPAGKEADPLPESEDEAKHFEPRKWEPTCKAVDSDLKNAGTGMRTMACRGDEIIVGSSKSVVKVWKVGDGKVAESRQMSYGALGACCVEAKDQYVVVIYDDGTIGLWDLRQDKPARVVGLESHIGNACKARFVPTHSHMLITGGTAGSLNFWDLRMPRQIDELVPEVGPAAKTQKSPASLVSEEPTHKRRKAEAARLPSPIYSLAVSNDGKLLGCGRSSGEISVLRIHADGQSADWVPDGDVSAHRSEAPLTPVRGLSFDTSSRLLLSGGDDSHLCVLDADHWARHGTPGTSSYPQLERCPAHRQWVSDVAVCPDPSQRIVLSTSWDGTAKLWDFRTHAALRTYKEHGSDAVLSGAWGSSSASGIDAGHYFATGGADAQLVVYTAKEA